MEKSNESYFQVGQVPVGIGAQMRGWDVTEDHFRDPDTLPLVDFLAMTEKCPHNCPHCFTNKILKTLTREEIFAVIDQLAEWKTHGINFVGEGEPTLDKDFFAILEYTSSKGIIPVVFTDGATRMTDRDFVRRVKAAGASVSPKCDSLYDEKYQNWVLESDKDGNYFDYDSWERNPKKKSMFQGRNEAVKIMMEEGFNEVTPEGTTRMGFDMLVTKRNMHEVASTLRFCRENNLWIVFAFYLPSGRSGKDSFDNSMAPSEEEREIIRKMVQQIDRDEFEYDHPIFTNFITQPCVELMQVHGNGEVNVCPGYSEVIGNVRKQTVTELVQRVFDKSPCRHPSVACGGCPPREEKMKKVPAC